MTMLPIFMAGLLLGWLCCSVFVAYKKETPSEMKLKTQQAEIIRQKSDNEMLHDLIERLYAKIDKLEKELNDKKEV